MALVSLSPKALHLSCLTCLFLPSFVQRRGNRTRSMQRAFPVVHILLVTLCSYLFSRCPCHDVQRLMRQKRCIECCSKTYKAAYPLNRMHITVWDSALCKRSVEKVVGAWLRHPLYVSELSLLCLGVKVTARKMIIHSTSCVT